MLKLSSGKICTQFFVLFSTKGNLHTRGFMCGVSLAYQKYPGKGRMDLLWVDTRLLVHTNNDVASTNASWLNCSFGIPLVSQSTGLLPAAGASRGTCDHQQSTLTGSWDLACCNFKGCWVWNKEWGLQEGWEITWCPPLLLLTGNSHSPCPWTGCQVQTPRASPSVLSVCSSLLHPQASHLLPTQASGNPPGLSCFPEKREPGHGVSLIVIGLSSPLVCLSELSRGVLSEDTEISFFLLRSNV